MRKPKKIQSSHPPLTLTDTEINKIVIEALQKQGRLPEFDRQKYGVFIHRIKWRDDPLRFYETIGLFELGEDEIDISMN